MIINLPFWLSGDEYDPSFTIAGAEAYHNDVPAAEVHILDAGHFALDEQAPEVIRLTELFLQKQRLQ